jgi:hypothetical protein
MKDQFPRYDKHVVPENIKPQMSGPEELELTWDGLPGVDYNVRYWKLGQSKQNLTVKNSSSAVVQLPAGGGGTMMWNIQVGWAVGTGMYQVQSDLETTRLYTTRTSVIRGFFPESW